MEVLCTTLDSSQMATEMMGITIPWIGVQYQKNSGFRLENPIAKDDLGIPRF